MSDEIMTRNSAGELELRTVQTTGDTGNDKNDVLTRDSQGRLCVRTTGSGGGSGGKNYDAEIEALDNAVSVLSTSVDLSTEIGGKTTVALADLSAMDIDGRPSYKQAGATVYADNGVVGIIDSVDSTNAVITTVSTSASVEKGHTWTKSQQINEYYFPHSLFLNFGKLADGNYEFLVKNPYGDGATAWGVRFRISGGNMPSAIYYPLPQLVERTKRGYATKDFGVYPIRMGVVGENVVFAGSDNYAEDVVGSVYGNNTLGGVFEFTDLLNLDTGEYLPVVESSVFLGDQYPVENIPYDVRGVSAYTPELVIPRYATGQEMWLYSPDGVFRGLMLSVGFNFGNSENNEVFFWGFPPIGAMYVFLANTDMSSLVVFKVNPKLNMWSVEVVEAKGLFNVDWYCDVSYGGNMNFYPETNITIPEGQELKGGVCAFGSGENGFLSGYSLIEEGYRGSYEPLLPLNVKMSIPTASSSGYILPHENGLVEMGGIVPITDTLQPNVALGNIPVVFPQELANANFVPTITVMTDGTFKQVMADVANPTVTGFDLCVRNVDTEAASNLKIAWKIVGTRK